MVHLPWALTSKTRSRKSWPSHGTNGSRACRRSLFGLTTISMPDASAGGAMKPLFRIETLEPGPDGLPRGPDPDRRVQGGVRARHLVGARCLCPPLAHRADATRRGCPRRRAHDMAGSFLLARQPACLGSLRSGRARLRPGPSLRRRKDPGGGLCGRGDHVHPAALRPDRGWRSHQRVAHDDSGDS